MRLQRGQAGEHTGHVLDGALSDEFMMALDAVRTSLPIDKEKKKTAAARRFFCADVAHGGLEWIRLGLVNAITKSIQCNNGSKQEKEIDEQEEAVVEVRILPWMRFLEYTEPNGALGPHTDALIRCKSTGQWSTHTLLVFCSDCDVGGETTLLPEEPKFTRMRERRLLKEQATVDELQRAIANITINSIATSDDTSDNTNNSNNTQEDKEVVDNNDTTAAARLKRLQSALQAAKSRHSTQKQTQSQLSQQCFPVKPKRGRIFYFPHECPHEGRPTVSVPKIFLRAELIISTSKKTTRPAKYKR